VVSKEVRIEQLNTRMQLMRAKLHELQRNIEIIQGDALITTSPYPSVAKERFKKELGATHILVIELHEMLGQIERIINRLELERS
jgi:hypothetical protein